MGLGVAFVWWCLAKGFGAEFSRPAAQEHCSTPGTCKGADQQGPPPQAAAPKGRPAMAGYAIGTGIGNFHSTNAQQGLNVEYRQDGFDLQVPGAAGADHCSFTLQGIGKGGVELHAGTGTEGRVIHNRLEWDHGTFRMLYHNTPEGMRHDLVVWAPPQGDGLLKARFRIGGGLQALQPAADEVVFHQFDPRAMDLVPVVRYNGLKCWDATGRVLPSSMRLENDELVLAVVDADAEYPVTIDPLSSTANLQLNGTQAGEDFGFRVATAGDVNGDGYSDILVGSPNWNTPFASAGRVQLFLGSASGIASTAAWSQQGAQANARLGFSVSSAGDVNGDGYSDVAIGAPGMASEGRVLVFAGGGTGLGAAPAYTLAGNNQAGCEFGASVALAGDVNGDGFSDLLVGAPSYNNGLAGQGKAYCYHGAAASLALGWSTTGVPGNGQLGFCVAGAGDLNGDGYSDAAIGAPYQPKAPTSNNGAVHLFRGNAGTGLGVASSSVIYGAGSANFGYSVSTAGDMNGDGYADLIVGAPGTTGGNGAALLHLGTSAASLVGLTATSSLSGISGEQLGHAVALAGDVNGDGFGDVVLGSPVYSSSSGRARVYRGSAAPLLDAAHLYWTHNGAAAGGRAGAAVGTAGDVNGDGISDLLVGAPVQGGIGGVKVFHGAPDPPATTAAWTMQGTADYQRLGNCVASAGDVNGDGYSDVLVGIPGGSTDLGQVMLFHGSATGLSATPAWTKSGENVNDGFGHAVASAGDVNGDGYSDVLIGAPRWPLGAINQWRGKVYLFLGAASGLAATPAWSKDGPQVESRFGYSLSSAGDVNGDGWSDVVIGAYTYDNGPGTGEGAAFVFHGSGTGLSANADWSAWSQQHYAGHSSAFGISVSLAGDVNGDGYDEVIIGDNYFETPLDGGDNKGAAFVYHGSPAGLSAAPNWAGYGADNGDEFGVSVCYAGDVNGDGHSDVVIGAHHKGTDYQGGAYVYHGAPGTGLQNSPAWSVNGVLIGDRMGGSVCAAGDVNGDGFGDVVIGTAMKDWSYVDGGGMEVYMGAAAGLSATAGWSVIGGSTGEKLGTSAALAGDVNGDGYSDVVGGLRTLAGNAYTEAGAAALYLGNRGMYKSVPAYQYRSDLATPVRTNNGTFQNDCQWGIGQTARSSSGRTLLKLAWHVAGHGPSAPTNFFDNNSTATTGEQAGWTDSGLPGVLLKQGLSTTAGSTSHPAWRARIRYHPATALDGRVFGRWYRQGVHDLQVPSIKTELTGCGPLPVTLVGASVACADGQAVVEWTTASEQDCAEFIVQRSGDAVQWEDLGRAACSGNSSQLRHYRFVDVVPVGGSTAYYRLEQVDINGAATVFPAMALAPCAQGESLAVWPNPFVDELNLLLPHLPAEAGMVAVTVRDMAGRVVLRQTVGCSGRQLLAPEETAMLPRGAYWIEVSTTSAGLLGRAMVVRM